MSTKYLRVNLEDMIEIYGEDKTKSILADFSCPKNKDVENFLKFKAIEFSKQSIAKTQLIYYIEDEQNPAESKRLVGYFSLTHKTINVSKQALSNKLKTRIRRFAKNNIVDDCYSLPVILIGQISKNYTDGNNELIEGSTLLELAFQSITIVQKYIGGKFVYLESEDKECLANFYKENGFSQFGKRELDRDEVDLDGKYLLQWICYMGKK